MSDIVRFYAGMLEAQAQLQFPFERFFFSHPLWLSSSVVVDFGCGDGSYLALLAHEFPQKRYFGIEANPDMRAVAQSRRAPSNISFHGSIAEINETKIDFVLMRYVVMHLAQRSDVFMSICEKLAESSAVLVIEPDDEKIHVTPEFPLFAEALEKIKDASHDRDLKNILDHEMLGVGLSRIYEAHCVMSNSIDQVERDLLRYMHSLIQIGLQTPLSMQQKAAMLDWHLERNRFVQFGFYGRLYSPNKCAML